MKKILSLVLILAALFCLVQSTSAAESDFISDAPDYDSFSIFQLGLFPMVPSWQNGSRVIGVKTGWPVCTGTGSRVDGFECSWIYSGTEYMNGLQASILMNYNRHCRGFQPALALNFSSRSLIGMQASCLFNLANYVRGVQAGGLNIVNEIEGFQPGVFGNFAKSVTGCQAGLYNITDQLNGCQIAGVNVAKNSDEGFQIGFINFSGGGKGMQFGLINIIPGGTLPVMLFFNYSD